MSEGQEGRAERIARYKEERRKQLAAQFEAKHNADESNKSARKDGGVSSSQSNAAGAGEGVRSTRASRLRAAAKSQDNLASPKSALSLSSDAISTVSGNESRSPTSRRTERDKSSKRKSNLNRSLNCEEVPPSPNELNDDTRSRRRRRRMFTPDILELSHKESTATIEDRAKNTAHSSETLSSSSTVQSSNATSNTAAIQKSTTPKKSELSVHMENARKGVHSSYSEMGKYKPFSKRSSLRSPKPLETQSDKESSHTRLSNKENLEKRNEVHKVSMSDTERKVHDRNLVKRMQGVTSMTHDTLARVEKLINKKKDAKMELNKSNSKEGEDKPSSILKKKSIEENLIVIESVSNSSPAPVSILKRKINQDEHSSTHTPPVTFSPNVVEPRTNTKKQGILKKRRSLDESQVMRHRSCSPDVAATKSDSRSILKNQRRSSLEDLTRISSPEVPLQSILKRRTSRCTDDDDQSLNSPQSILKRRSGASSAGSTGSTPHVSITTAVILAAARGAEMVIESDNELVKPILKKKSSSEEHTNSESLSEVPKPILKKKSSTDTDDYDDKPRPILKQSRNSYDEHVKLPLTSSSDVECDVRPILKLTVNCNREALVRTNRLSFCATESNCSEIVEETRHRSRRSNTICSNFQFKESRMSDKEEDRSMKKARPLSVIDLVMSFEKGSTGAIPKQRVAQKRNSDRYKTQPITSMELEASLNSIKSPTADHSYDATNQSVPSLIEFASPLNHESNLNTYLLSSFQEISPDSGICGKMSSDSAFQLLGDGLELEQEDNEVKLNEEPSQAKGKLKLEQSKLELQMKAIADEAKKLSLSKGGVGSERFRNRKSDKEVSSSRISSRKSKDTDESEDPVNLTVVEKVKLFTAQLDIKERNLRRRTQPVTLVELENACFYASLIDDSDIPSTSEKRGILKNDRHKSVSKPKSVLKSRNRARVSPNRCPTLKTDAHDEGISCNDSGSDMETNVPIIKCDKVADGDSTSDGESSGGREVKSIFKNDLKFKNALELALSKSKSQCGIAAIGDESINEKKSRKTNLRRSHTHSEAVMPRNIAEIRAKLQQNGENDWKKRIAQNNSATNELKLLTEKNRYNDELSEKSLLDSKKDELDQAAKQWKARVEKSDAEKFTVAGRMEKTRDRTPTINAPEKNEIKRTPQAKRFKGKESSSESSSTPVSPEKNCTFDLNRSKSVSESTGLKQDSDSDSAINTGRTVIVPKPDDFTFTKFYESVEQQSINIDPLDISSEDFDHVPRQQSLLVLKKNVQVQKRRMVSKNPIKALGNRTDITNEYYEIKTGVAEREKKRLNIEKLALNSNFAVEALAGLASKEDFKSVALKKGSSGIIDLQPFKDLMLLQIKGRRHVQTRLVEPVADSINEGDNFLLITPKALYNYVGEYSNIIEQSRAADIANVIQKTHDLGCRVKEIIGLSRSSNNKHLKEFWALLGESDVMESANAGEASEDEDYETGILSTNMIYSIGDNELIPVEEYSGSIPKYGMLEERKVFVFDFGSEMYVWSGKNAVADEKKSALQLAKQLWNEGYDYGEYDVCPLNIASLLGDRENKRDNKSSDKRPDWALFAKITQHRETVLFKEKFLDWPDFSRVIRVKSDEKINTNVHTEITAYNVKELLEKNTSEPDLVVEGTHLGRGQSYFDEATRRLFKYETIDLQCWRILDHANCESLDAQSLGQFYDHDTYIYNWRYQMTVMGRELNGQPSKHAQVGKERSVFFYWQGANSSVSEKCTAAYLTVQLDKQNAPQVRIEQGNEPAAFLHLFKGSMVVHEGKRGQDKMDSRLFIIRGELENEGYLMEVPCSLNSLRSRSSFFLINTEESEMILWHGCKSMKQKRRVAKSIVDNLMNIKADDLFMGANVEGGFTEMQEGKETEEFFDFLGNGERDLYVSLLDNSTNFDYTIRMFYMTSTTGKFIAHEELCPHRSEYSSPYPFVQTKLYSASQPALFLIDNNHELWLWQGWWPEEDVENDPIEQKTGSGIVRWQSERRAAMQTAVNYWRSLHEGDERVPAHLVWAGLEPLEFKNLFPKWTDREDVTELNLKEGKRMGEKKSLEMELSLLSRTTYKLEELLQRPLPNGVDPTHLERYLSSKEFEGLLLMTKEEFRNLPSWKQTALKKEKGLF